MKKSKRATIPSSADVEDWGPSPEERYEQTQLHDILNEAISELDPNFRIVFQLRDIEEMSTEETADVLRSFGARGEVAAASCAFETAPEVEPIFSAE